METTTINKSKNETGPITGTENTPAILSREAVESAKNVVVAEPTIEFALQVGNLEARVRMLEAQITQAKTPAEQTGKVPEGIYATMVGGMFNCPECGLRINGPSLTAVQGSKSAYYEHPFGEAPKLNNQRCRLIGVKFKSPIVLLEFVNPSGLTATK